MHGKLQTSQAHKATVDSSQSHYHRLNITELVSERPLMATGSIDGHEDKRWLSRAFLFVCVFGGRGYAASISSSVKFSMKKRRNPLH